MKIKIVENNVINFDVEAIGVIAATTVDTELGLELLKQKNIPATGVSISNTPQEQTRLQALNKPELTKIVIKAVKLLESQGIRKVMIYCNSLSGAIDLPLVLNKTNATIATPIEVYEKLALSHSQFGLLAANGQSVGNIEKRILKKNKNAFVIGYGNINIVYDVENKISPDKIIKKHSLHKICNYLGKSGAEIIILGCTHFPYFYEQLAVETDAKLFEPSEEMINILMDKEAPIKCTPKLHY